MRWIILFVLSHFVWDTDLVISSGSDSTIDPVYALVLVCNRGRVFVQHFECLGIEDGKYNINTPTKLRIHLVHSLFHHQ